jgi:hypothetical protein
MFFVFVYALNYRRLFSSGFFIEKNKNKRKSQQKKKEKKFFYEPLLPFNLVRAHISSQGKYDKSTFIIFLYNIVPTFFLSFFFPSFTCDN